MPDKQVNPLSIIQYQAKLIRNDLIKKDIKRHQPIWSSDPFESKTKNI